MALQHDATQTHVASQALLDHRLQHRGLAQWVLATVGVAAIDHDARGNPLLFQRATGSSDTGRVVVGCAVAAAQDQMGIRIAARLQQCRMAEIVDAEVLVWMFR